MLQSLQPLKRGIGSHTGVQDFDAAATPRIQELLRQLGKRFPGTHAVGRTGIAEGCDPQHAGLGLETVSLQGRALRHPELVRVLYEPLHAVSVPKADLPIDDALWIVDEATHLERSGRVLKARQAQTQLESGEQHESR